MDIKMLIDRVQVNPEDIKEFESLSEQDYIKLYAFAKQAYNSYIEQLAKVGELEQKIKDIETQKKVKNGFKPAEKREVSSSVLYELRAKGKPVNEIAKMYNISRATVWRKLKEESEKRKNWKSEDNIFVENSDVEEECMMYKMEHLIVEETIIKDNKHYDWENEDEIDIQIENYILSVLFSLLSYSELK